MYLKIDKTIKLLLWAFRGHVQVILTISILFHCISLIGFCSASNSAKCVVVYYWMGKSEKSQCGFRGAHSGCF